MLKFTLSSWHGCTNQELIPNGVAGRNVQEHLPGEMVYQEMSLLRDPMEMWLNHGSLA
jgi:hypothetical protein